VQNSIMSNYPSFADSRQMHSSTRCTRASWIIASPWNNVA
jgi:hypothetical protein